MSLQTRAEVAEWLGVSDKGLRYLLYRLNPLERYKKFTIPKRSGGVREIASPISFLKRIQAKIAEVLPEASPPRGIAKAYIQGRGIVDNAQVHKRSRWIVTLDLADFFPSINFGRVRGMFLAPPFSLNSEVATVLANICCLDGVLPQGAPTSPYISNIICRSLDRDLLAYASNVKMRVTRYADDICFSTNVKTVPTSLVVRSEDKFVVSRELETIIQKRGFKVNHSKTRVTHRSRRQMVTGIVVNSKGAMPREWRRRNRVIARLLLVYGADKAGEIISKWKSFSPKDVDAAKRLRGLTTFAAHLDKEFRTKHMAALRRSYPGVADHIAYHPELRRMDVFVEGKTDAQILEFAFRDLRRSPRYQDLQLVFPSPDGQSALGDAALLKNMEGLAARGVQRLSVGLFDFDSPAVLAKVKLSAGEYRPVSSTSDNVLIAILPEPKYSEDNGFFSIEHFFPVDFILRETDEGRRLYYRREFDSRSGSHSDQPVYLQNSSNKSQIVDDLVFNKHTGANVALSKAEFARLVIHKIPPYHDADPMWFADVFDLLRDIART